MYNTGDHLYSLATVSPKPWESRISTYFFTFSNPESPSDCVREAEMLSNHLPVEIVERICGYLDRYGVFQVALVSRNFRNGAVSKIFHTVSVRCTSQDTFRENCEYAQSVLASPRKARQVRHFRVFGLMKGDTSIGDDWNSGLSRRNRSLDKV